MELKIENERYNPVIERWELICRVTEQDAVPSRGEVVEKLAGMRGVDKELVIIRKIKPEFGKRESVVIANIYKNIEVLKEIEPEYIIARHKKHAEDKQKKNEEKKEGQESEEKAQEEQPKQDTNDATKEKKREG
jgi:small subunit ribosomal protein S24e